MVDLKKIKELIDQAVELGVIVENSEGFVFDEEFLGNSKKEIEVFLSKNKKILSAIAEAVKEQAEEYDGDEDDEDDYDYDEDEEDEDE